MHPQARRKPLRMDAQDGPWSISVADNDPRSYSIYIQTPTHHLTLTRTVSEIIDLHAKLSDFNPPELPPLPVSEQPAKRRSSFLHTLSRLANNPSKSSAASASSSKSSAASASSSKSSVTYPTPAVSPSKERDDPFAASPLPPSAAATSLAAYLTELSNRSAVRTSRPWRRFVRVRTDDLESVRVERAIKRVRSDLAIHHPAPTPATVLAPLLHSNNVSDVESAAEDDHDLHERESAAASLHDLHIKEEDEDEALASIREDAKIAELIANEGDVDLSSPTLPTPSIAAPPPAPEPLSPVTPVNVEPQPLFEPEQQQEEEEHEAPATSTEPAAETEETTETQPDQPQPPSEPSPTLPTPAPSPPSPPTPPPHPAMRIPRSASADPDKASRLSRAWQDPATTPPPKKSSSSSTPKPKRKVVVDDFEMMRVLGKGCAGKVLLVRHKASSNLYALKAITKRHVLAHQELQHTLTEQAVLKRMAHEAKDPFVVKLWWSFHDKENLFLVMDFHPGGDLATQLARWGRLGRDRARFYAAEIVEGVEGLHAAGVIYRDLKPENILIGADGHIVLTDFGLSKEFPRKSDPNSSNGANGAFYSSPGTPGPTVPHWMNDGHGQSSTPGSPGSPSSGRGSPGGASWMGPRDVTTTFCGTAEYLAPEVIQGLPYSYEVDWWSFGTMLYEMLTGITPFWANNHSDMYVRVLQDELQFPDDKAMDQDTKSLIRGLLQRNPALRMSEPRIKRHPYFSMIDWSHVYYKRYIPPYIPPIDPSNASDTQNFDETFLDMEPIIDNPDEGDEADESRGASPVRATPTATGEDGEEKDMFDGYSFKGRHSVIMDDEEEGEEDAEREEEGEEEVGVGEEDVEEGAEATVEEEAEKEAEPTGAEAEAPATPATPVETEPHLRADSEDAAATPTQATGTPTVEGPATPSKAPDVALPDIPPPVPLKGALKASSEPSQVATRPAAPPKAVTIAPQQSSRRRPEKSGVTALDRVRSAAMDEGSATEREEYDDEDDDWDFVETPGGEDRNGSKGTSLFARGVVDRYRLAVFRKASGTQHQQGQRTVSGASSTNGGDEMGSPESVNEKRRGRIGRSTGRFLARARSPPASMSRSVSSGIATSHSLVGSMSTATSRSSMPTTAMTPTQTPQSLRSKDSTMSMGAPSSGSVSSDTGSLSRERTYIPTAVNGGTANGEKRATEEKEQEGGKKLKKMKKYKEGAEKVLSLFGSPRQERTQATQS